MSGLGAGESEMEGPERAKALAERVNSLARLLDGNREEDFCEALVSFCAAHPASLERELDSGLNRHGPATLLGKAAERGLADAVAALLRAGADPLNKAEGVGGAAEGSSPLHWTAFSWRSGAPCCLELLIAGGAQVDCEDASGATPLGWAARRGALRQMAALAAAGARLSPPSESPVCPWSLAHSNEQVEALEMLGRIYEVGELRAAAGEGEAVAPKGPRL